MVMISLLKTVRLKVDRGITGKAISKLRRTKNGELLIVINMGNDSAEVVKAELIK